MDEELYHLFQEGLALLKKSLDDLANGRRVDHEAIKDHELRVALYERRRDVQVNRKSH